MPPEHKVGLLAAEANNVRPSHPRAEPRPQPVSGLHAGSLSRSLGALYTAGGTLALVWVTLPHRPDGGDAVVVAMALVAIGLGAGLALAAGRVSRVGQHAAIALIQVVIAVAYVAEGRPESDVRLFFLWATPYAALYFRRRTAGLHLLWTSVVALLSLALMPGETRPQAYGVALVLLGSLLATGLLVLLAARALTRAEHAQRHEATHDGLTGLPNRSRLLAVLRAVPAERTAALVLLDLERFELVNDRIGHAGADALLVEVGRALATLVRPDDLVARSGGDEFALVLHDVADPEEVLAVTRRALAALAAVGRPGLLARAGVRLLPAGERSVSRVLTDADAALDLAKRSAGGVVLWQTGMRPAGTGLQELAEDLRVALRTEQLSLVYQPVVDIRTMRVLGVEVLTRWHHPLRGQVSPVDFVACAERTGLIDELTRWVLRTACREALTWPVPADGYAVNLAVNVSATQLADLRLVADVRAALDDAGLPAGRVVLEVTETAEVVDLGQAELALDALHALGVTLALDDFGTGYSSLSHVQALPFDILKVDRSFVAASGRHDRRAVATIAAVCALAERLSVDVVAEGVEDVGELDALRELGCTHAQGFGLARPMSAASLRERMAGQGPHGWVLPAGTSARRAVAAAPAGRTTG